MLIVLWVFLLFQIFYHSIVTIGGYGLAFFAPEKIAIFRDMVRMLIAGVSFLYAYKQRSGYFQWRKKIWICFIGLMVFTVSLSFFYFDKTLQEILIGIKYDLRYFVILLWASWWGYFLAQNNKVPRKKVIRIITWALLGIVVWGWLRQFAKLLFPDFFMQIGYGALDDFHFGMKPPIYYLTGYEGTLRRQGIFSWPNNYGYFLTLFLPLMLTLFPLPSSLSLQKRKKTDRVALGIQLLWIITILATLSRAALIATIIIFILHYRSLLRKNTKVLWLLAVILLIGSLSLTILKRDSTLIHVQKKFWAFADLIHQPQGYGLGSAWPAIHHTWKFLPENFYFQLLLDMGTVGFIWRCIVLYLFLSMQTRLNRALKHSPTTVLSPLLLAFQQGFFVFLIVGLFLHIFEDSMVNYLFLVPYGILLGYLQHFYDHQNLVCWASWKKSYTS